MNDALTPPFDVRLMNITASVLFVVFGVLVLGTLASWVGNHALFAIRAKGAALAIMGFEPVDPLLYGRILRGADIIRHLRKCLGLFSQRRFCGRYQCIQFGQSVRPDQQLGGRCAVAVCREAIPAAQLPGKRYHALTRCQCCTIVLFDNPHMGKACSQFLRCVDIMDQGIVGQSIHRGRPAQPTASGIPTNCCIGIITQRSGQCAFVARPNLDTVNRLVAVPFGKGPFEGILLGQQTRELRFGTG